MSESKSQKGSADHLGVAPGHLGGVIDLLSYLIARGLLETETTSEANGTKVITYHLTAKGLELLDKFLELLELLLNSTRRMNWTR